MRITMAILLSGIAVSALAASAQSAPPQAAASTPPTTQPGKPADPNLLVIPAGTKVPLALKHAISTKSAREGDPVYAETNFPVVLNDRILIPAGTYVQGKIMRVQRAGRIKGRSEMLLHFTTLIYPNGYTVLLPGALDSVPGSEKTKMKGEEGTIQQDSQKGKDAGQIATAAGEGAEGGAIVGAVASRSTGGTLAGAGAGAVLGAAIAMLSRGADARLEKGETVEMVIQREVTLDASRIRAPAQ
jgi:hypothetical protein